MEMHPESTGLHDTQRSDADYCREHLSAFRLFLNAEAAKLFFQRSLILVALFAVAILANMPKLGSRAVFAYMPGLLVALAPVILRFVSNQYLRLLKHGVAFVDALVVVGVAGAASTIAIAWQQGAAVNNGPILSALLIAGFFSYHSSIYAQIARGVSITLVAFLVVFVFDPMTTKAFAGQFIGGLGFSVFLGIKVLRTHQSQFRRVSVERRLNTHLVSELESMVYPHQLSMLRVKHTLSETMPLNRSTAFVAEFDIIGSSAFAAMPIFESAKRASFSSCYSELLSQYCLNPSSPERPYSLGHLVKEMGDGFIYSVGYPFEVPDLGNPADTSLLLGLKFIDIFNKQMDAFSKVSRPTSAVVIVQDSIRGFWTSYQVKSYDFEQTGMTKVNRLGAFRKELLKRFHDRFPPGDYVIVDDQTYFALSDQVKAPFLEVDLRDLDMQIRGYPDLLKVYIRLIGRTSLYGLKRNQGDSAA